MNWAMTHRRHVDGRLYDRGRERSRAVPPCPGLMWLYSTTAGALWPWSHGRHTISRGHAGRAPRLACVPSGVTDRQPISAESCGQGAGRPAGSEAGAELHSSNGRWTKLAESLPCSLCAPPQPSSAHLEAQFEPSVGCMVMKRIMV